MHHLCALNVKWSFDRRILRTVRERAPAGQSKMDPRKEQKSCWPAVRTQHENSAHVAFRLRPSTPTPEIPAIPARNIVD